MPLAPYHYSMQAMPSASHHRLAQAMPLAPCHHLAQAMPSAPRHHVAHAMPSANLSDVSDAFGTSPCMAKRGSHHFSPRNHLSITLKVSIYGWPSIPNAWLACTRRQANISIQGKPTKLQRDKPCVVDDVGQHCPALKGYTCTTMHYSTKQGICQGPTAAVRQFLSLKLMGLVPLSVKATNTDMAPSASPLYQSFSNKLDKPKTKLLCMACMAKEAHMPIQGATHMVHFHEFVA
ncbi:unnamed protein product [Prunus armeniaca]|uniref:Uncharacterized protein n=1 Tax=Prunus armeniaca TaxID=36596 RepID=A0A6J5U130_PRUAR|nr:unnamed protein product [Prunus armeniaca]